MSAPDVPPVGITLLPPWWWLILHGGKDVENRSRRVVEPVRYQGPVLLTASAGFLLDDGRRRPIASKAGKVNQDVAHAIKGIVRDVRSIITYGPDVPPLTLRELHASAGCAVGIVDIVGVIPAHEWKSGGWHARGAWGLRLANPRPIEPRPATGGLGLWRVTECERCGRVLAKGARHRCEVRP